MEKSSNFERNTTYSVEEKRKRLSHIWNVCLYIAEFFYFDADHNYKWFSFFFFWFQNAFVTFFHYICDYFLLSVGSSTTLSVQKNILFVEQSGNGSIFTRTGSHFSESERLHAGLNWIRSFFPLVNERGKFWMFSNFQPKNTFSLWQSDEFCIKNVVLEVTVIKQNLQTNDHHFPGFFFRYIFICWLQANNEYVSKINGSSRAEKTKRRKHGQMTFKQNIKTIR